MLITHEMSLFSWLRGDPAHRTEQYVEPGLLRRLIELEERQKAQEKAFKAIDTEWSEWYDKFRLMYGRLAKRIKEASQAQASENGEQESSQDAPGRTISTPPSLGHPQFTNVPTPYTRTRRNY